MKILIIGGTQFIGPYVVEQLYNLGHEVILFNRGNTPFSLNIPIKTIPGNRFNLPTYKQTLINLHPEVVIDMIPHSQKDAEQLVEVFSETIRRIIIISSCDVYQAYDRLWKASSEDICSEPLVEGSELRTNLYPYRKFAVDQNDWRYHYDKLLVEKTIQNCPDFANTILRLPMVYGPRDYWRIYPYLKRMDDAKPILLDENKAMWRFSRGFVKDIAHAIVLAAVDTRKEDLIYNVSEAHSYTELAWIEFISQVAGTDTKIVKLPQDQLPAHLRELLDWKQDLILDSSLIRKDLNYHENSSPEQSMKESIAWLRRNPPKEIDTQVFNYEKEDEVVKTYKIRYR